MEGSRASQRDLYLTVKVAAHPEFHRKGSDLHCDSPLMYILRYWAGRLWSDAERAVKSRYSAETQNHKVLRASRLACRFFGKTNVFGDLLRTIDVICPTSYTAGTDLFRKLAV